MTSSVLRGLLVFTGVVAYYCAFIMYPDEQGRWQNRLEEFWVAMDDRSLRSRNTTALLLTSVSGIVTNGFDRLFGQELLSFRFIRVSFMLSISGFIFSYGLPFHLGGGHYRIGWANYYLIAGAAGFLIALSRSRLATALSALLVCVILSIGLFFFRDLRTGGDVFLDVFVSLLSDALLVVLIRSTLRSVLITATTSRIALALVIQLLAITLFVIAPFVAAFRLISIENHINNTNRGAWTWAWTHLALIGRLNISTAVASFAFSSVLLVLLIHRLTWPLVARFIFPLARFEVIRNTKVTAGLGTLCFISAFPSMSAAAKRVLEWLGK